MPVRRIGSCNMCGDCCRIELREARLEAYRLSGVAVRLTHGVEGCPDFDPESGRCKNYAERPYECRNFPVYPEDLIALPRCGYSFIEVTESGKPVRR